jgi:hypothetical protein
MGNKISKVLHRTDERTEGVRCSAAFTGGGGAEGVHVQRSVLREMVFPFIRIQRSESDSPADHRSPISPFLLASEKARAWMSERGRSSSHVTNGTRGI